MRVLTRAEIEFCKSALLNKSDTSLVHYKNSKLQNVSPKLSKKSCACLLRFLYKVAVCKVSYNKYSNCDLRCPPPVIYCKDTVYSSYCSFCPILNYLSSLHITVHSLCLSVYFFYRMCICARLGR